MRAVLGAIVLSPLQKALVIPEPFPVRLPSELLALAAIAFFAVRRRRDADKVARSTDAVLVLLLGVTVLASAAGALLRPPGSEMFRVYALGPGLDLAWFTTRALIVLGLWALCRRVVAARTERAFRAAAWLAFGGVLFQQFMMSRGATHTLEVLGFNTTTSGVLLGNAARAMTRSGTFPNGQELGFFAVVVFFIMLRRRWYLSAGVCLYGLAYSMSTAGFLGLAVGLLGLFVLSRSSRTRLVAGIIGAGGLVAVFSSRYLSALLEFQLAKLGFAESAVRYAGQSLEIRTIKTEIALRMAADNPLLGVGAARFGNYAGDYAGAGAVPQRTLITVENAYAQVLCEHGVFAFVLFAGLLVWMAIRLLRSRLHFELAALLALGVVMTTQSMWTQSLIWLVLGYLASRLASAADASAEGEAPDETGGRLQNPGPLRGSAPSAGRPSRLSTGTGGNWVRGDL